MPHLHGTNHATVDPSDFTFGKFATSTSAASLTSETGPLKYGVYLVTPANCDIYVNSYGGSPEVTLDNGMLMGQNNPLFIPIKDPSVLRVISDTGAKAGYYWMA